MKNWLIFGLVILSLFFHLIKLGQNPTLIADEASIGYNAYSILKTGRDEWGKFLPLSFKAFGEYKLPLYIYFSILPIFLFGLNVFSVRLISALSGALNVYLVYLLIKHLKPKKEKKLIFPILVAFLFAINPWNIQISRMAVEVNLALFFFLLGMVYFNRSKMYQALIFFGLTFYTYNAFRVFIPFFFILNIIFKPSIWKNLKKPLLILLLIISPLIVTGFKGSGERFFKTSIFTDPGIILRVQEKRILCQKQLSPALCRLVFNRPIAYASEISRNYFSHFNLPFLTRGAGLAQYSLPNFGVIYYYQLPLLLLGFWQMFKEKQLSVRLLPWLIAAPMATSVTGPAHPLRSLIFMPLLPIISSLGIVLILRWLNKWQTIFLSAIFGLSILSLIIFLNLYFRFYPTQTGSIWQSAYRTLYQDLAKVKNNYDQIRITKFYGEPHIFYLFYRQIDPSILQSSQSQINRYDRSDHWVNVDRINKYYFFEQPDFQTPGLVVLAAYESQPAIIPNKTIFFTNNEPAFRIYEIK